MRMMPENQSPPCGGGAAEWLCTEALVCFPSPVNKLYLNSKTAGIHIYTPLLHTHISPAATKGHHLHVYMCTHHLTDPASVHAPLSAFLQEYLFPILQTENDMLGVSSRLQLHVQAVIPAVAICIVFSAKSDLLN